MQTPKILFSPEELRLAEQSELILTKNRIIKKVIEMFASLTEAYRLLAEEKRDVLPDVFFILSPKISRGEQYLGLPYVMLDYPRVFSKEHVLAIRTFFWWGNYFSLTLHLKGSYYESVAETIKQHLFLFSQEKYSIAISEDEWRHDFEQENYVPLKEGSISLVEQSIRRSGFLKLAVRWPLEKTNEIETLLIKQYSHLLQVITG